MAPPEVQLTGPAAALLAFNTRTTTLAVRCPDREYGCEHLNLPILRLNCDLLRFTTDFSPKRGRDKRTRARLTSDLFDLSQLRDVLKVTKSNLKPRGRGPGKKAS